VLIRFDMSAKRQPTAGVDVVDQQHAAVSRVDRHDSGEQWRDGVAGLTRR
jgi:hypothetical protein